jgi:hypothetical protein
MLPNRIDPETGIEYHIDYHPPDDDALIKERLQRLPDADVLEAKLPEQFSIFAEHQPLIDDWFKQFGNIFTVDALQPMEHVWELIGGLVRRVMDKQEADVSGKANSSANPTTSAAAATATAPITVPSAAPVVSASSSVRPLPPPLRPQGGSGVLPSPPATSSGPLSPTSTAVAAATAPSPPTAKPIDVSTHITLPRCCYYSLVRN